MGALSGLSATETMHMPPGRIFDLWDLYLDQKGVKKNQGDIDRWR